MWTVEELSSVMQMPAHALRRRAAFWQSHGLLREEPPDTLILVEEVKGHSHDNQVNLTTSPVCTWSINPQNIYPPDIKSMLVDLMSCVCWICYKLRALLLHHVMLNCPELKSRPQHYTVPC